MNKVIEYIISAKDATASAVKGALDRVKNFSKSVIGNLANIQAGFGMLKSAVSQAMAFMQKAFAYETYTRNFKTLIGNLDEAREHMKMLQAMGDTPPFSLEQFAAASKQLLVMSNGVLGYKHTLELVGDAATATGNSLESLSHAVGLAYSMIRDGQPLSRATMQLRQMGVITPEVAKKMTELQAVGASSAEIWKELETSLGRYKGAMEETEKTGEGLMSAIGAQWDNTVRDLGAAFLDCAKDGLGALLDKMKESREDGSLQVWAQEFAEFFEGVIDGANKCKNALIGFWEYSGLSDAYNIAEGATKGTFGFFARAAEGLSNGEGFSAISNGAKHADEVMAMQMQNGYYTKQLSQKGYLGKYMKWASDWDDYYTNEDKRTQKVYAQDRLKKKREQEAKEKQTQEEKRLKEISALEEADRKRAEKASTEAAKKQAEEEEKARIKAAEEAAKKQAEEEEKARVELEREIAKERQRLWQIDFKAQQRALQDAQKEDADARTRLLNAQQKAQEAWGWYRNRDSWKAQLEEERANAEAEKQYEKDFARLKSKRRDWRTGKLNDDDELIKRVALAREEEAAAREWAKQTAEACARTAEAVEAMQTVLEEEG